MYLYILFNRDLLLLYKKKGKRTMKRGVNKISKEKRNDDNKKDRLG